MKFKDYCQTLSVERDAEPEEIERLRRERPTVRHRVARPGRGDAATMSRRRR
jgi:hypothetical protein